MRDQRLHDNAINAITWGVIIGIAAAGLWIDGHATWAWFVSVLSIGLAAGGTALLLVWEGRHGN